MAGTRYVRTEHGDANSSRPVSSQIRPTAKVATVPATATGVVYTLARLLSGTSQLALINGTNANLKLDAANGAISATSAIGDGISQKAMVRENDGDVALEYPVTLIGLASGVLPLPTPTVAISAAQSKNEGNSGTTGFVYTVTRSAAIGAVSVPWSFSANGTSADDFAGGAYPQDGTVELADGVASGTFSVAVNGDTTVEQDETFGVSIAAPSGYAAGATMSATGTMLNDDVNALPTVTISASQSKSEGNAGSVAYIYTVTRSASAGAVLVAWQFAPGTTSAEDFAGGTYPAGGTISLADGDAAGTFSVNVNGDTAFESDETFTVSLAVPTGYAAGSSLSATGTIVNNDTAPTLGLASVAPSIASNAAAGTLVSNITNVPAGVTPSVTPNDGRLVIAGDASAGWKVVRGMSGVSEGTLNFSVAATGATGASGVLTVTAATSNLRQVANNCRVLTNAVAGAGAFNAWTAHTASDGASPRLVIPNWRWNSSTGADTNSGFEQTYEASLEYPVGTYTRVTFGGLNVGNMTAAMDELVADAASVIPPKGALYRFRVYMSTSTGYYTFSKDPVGDAIPASVACLEYGASVTNKVMGGTITQTNSGIAWFPNAIISDSTAPSVPFVGDSIGRGANGAWTAAGYHGYLEEAIGGKFGVINIGAYGDTASSFINGSNSAKRRALLRYCSLPPIVEYGCNDVNGSTSASNIINNLNTLGAFFSAKGYYRTTLTPRSSGAWTLADGSDQTVATNFAPGGKHDTVQAAIKAGLPNALGVFDPIPAVFDMTTNKWLADGTTNKNTIDGVHPSPVAVSAMAAMISSQVQAMDGSAPVTDTTPDAFAFTDATNAAPSTLTASNAITVSGINAASAISVSGGEYQINGGSWMTANSAITNGQSVKVRLTTSSAASTTSNVTLTIGGVSDTFSVTTAAAAGQTGLLSRTATLAAWDASDRTTMFQSADSSVPVTATAQPVARMNDKRGVNNYHLIAPTDAQRPLSTGGLTFDGTDDSLNFAFAGTGPTLGTMIYIVKTTDTVGSIGNNTSSTTAFHGAFKSGDTGGASFGTNGSNIRYAKDGVALSSITRNTLFTNICDGVAHVLEVNTITMTQYVGLAIAYSRYDATFMASGVIIPVALLDQNASDYADALTEARAFAQAIIGRLGI